MPKIETITCDYQKCGKDITYTGNVVGYRLVLASESKSPWYEKEGKQGGVVTDMMIYPPIKRNHYYCNLRCLEGWVDDRKSAREEAKGGACDAR